MPGAPGLAAFARPGNSRVHSSQTFPFHLIRLDPCRMLCTGAGDLHFITFSCVPFPGLAKAARPGAPGFGSVIPVIGALTHESEDRADLFRVWYLLRPLTRGDAVRDYLRRYLQVFLLGLL